MADDDLFNIDVVREFMVDRGGKVRNHELVTHFKSYLSDPRYKGSNRQKFKTFVNTLATVKLDESGEKVLVLKKKFREDESATASAPASSYSKPSKLERPKAKLKDALPLRKPSEDEQQTKGAESSESLLDSIQKELSKPKEVTDPVVPTPDYDGTAEEPVPDYDEKDQSNEAVVNEPEPDYDSSSRDDSEVFQDAESEPPKPCTEEKPKEEASSESASDFQDSKEVIVPEIKEESVEIKAAEDHPTVEVVPIDDKNQKPKESDMSGGESTKAQDSKSLDEKPDASKTQTNTETKDIAKPSEEPAELEVTINIKDRVKHLNKITSETNLQSPSHVGHIKKSQKRHDTEEGGQALIHLGEVEREWLIVSAKADYHPMAKLLNKNPQLAKRKDFTNGYTALHWAAKHGNADIVKMLCGTPGVFINARSNGGYTPLHLAAIQGHEEVIEILVQAYGADANLRDYSGKKPKQYLKNAAASHIQQLLQVRKPSQSLVSNFKRSGSYSSKINTAGHFGIKANTAMRTSWADNKKSVSQSPSESPRHSPGLGRKSSNTDDFLMMPPPQEIPMRRKKSKQKNPMDSISSTSSQDMSRSGSDPMLSKSEVGMNQPVHQSTSYTSFV